MAWRGAPVAHSAFFASYRLADRVGIVTPAPFDGLGAITLAMAYVTAFYDCYRARGGDFFAYPDFFAFERQAPPADYAMCDIWPPHKNVLVPDRPQETLEAIVDRAVTVLLVPDGPGREAAFEPAAAESARRNIARCFAYSPDGEAAEADLAIECAAEPLLGYAMAVFDSAPVHDAEGRLRRRWRERIQAGRLRQSFREIALDDALRRL